MRALGTIDELNAHLGMAASMGLTPTLVALLHESQQDLLNLGSDLAVPGSDPIRLPIPSVDATQVQLLESIIDIARTVCRRAEREMVALARRGRRGAGPTLSQPAVGCALRDGLLRKPLPGHRIAALGNATLSVTPGGVAYGGGEESDAPSD